MNLNDAVLRFFEVGENENRLTEKTRHAYSYDLANFSELLKNKSVRLVDASDIDRFHRYLRDSLRLKPTTIRRRLMSLRTFCRYCVSAGLMNDDPFSDLEWKFPDGNGEKEIRRISIADVARMLDSAEKEVAKTARLASNRIGARLRQTHANAVRDRAVIEMLFATAMRIGELAEMNLDDLDIAKQTVRIGGKERTNRALRIGAQPTVTALEDYLSFRNAAKSTSRALFLNRYGERLSIVSLENIFHRYCKTARVRSKITPNTFRYAMAVLLMNQGMSASRIKKMIGHCSILTSWNSSERAMSRRQKTAMDRMKKDGRLTLTLAPGASRRA